jgi:sigma-B regulation protein RsbU (phosphoserine phosphatase)
MSQSALDVDLKATRMAALAELIRTLAAAPDLTTVGQQAVKAVRLSFPSASLAQIYRCPGAAAELVPLASGADSLLQTTEAVQALRRATEGHGALDALVPLPAAGPDMWLAAAPILHGGAPPLPPTRLGALAIALPGTVGWPAEDAAWLNLLAQQVGLGLAQAQARDEQRGAVRRYREMSEAIEARAQARLEQLAGRGRQLEALFELTSQISMTLDEAQVTAMALDHLVELTGSRFGFVAMVSPTEDLELCCARGLSEAETAALRSQLANGLRSLVAPVTQGRRALRQNQEAELPSADRKTGLRLDSLLAVSLPNGDRSLGVLVLVGRLPGYDEADERLVSMFGAQLAVAVQNARLVARIEGSLQIRRRELTSLSRTAQELAAAVDEAQVLQRVVAIIHETFDARAAWVMLREKPGAPLRMRRYQGSEEERLTAALEQDEDGSVAEALRTLLPVFRPAAGSFAPCTPGDGPQTMLCVPLVVQERALGVLGLDSNRFSAQRPPRPQDLDLIQAFASQAAVAIENARHIDSAVRRTRRERLLNEITDAVREPLGVEDILDRAVERLGAALEVSRCVALLPVNDGEYREHIWTELGCELPADEVLWESCPVVQRLEETGQPVLLSDTAARLASCKVPDGVAAPQALLGVPAVRAGELKALFLFHQCDRPRAWSDDDLSLAQRVVAQVAVAVENAHLYEQELKQEQFQRTMAEIATAVGASVELTQVLHAVGEHGMRLVDADAAYIWRLEPGTRELVSAAAVGHKADRFVNLRLPLTRRSFHVVRAALERRPIAAHGVSLDRQASQRLNRMFDCQSLLVVPLVVRQELFGVVQFSATATGARFDSDQVARSEILVSQAAAAVENAQLYEAEHGRAEELEVLWRIGQEIAEKLEPERIYNSIVAGARRVFGVDAASLTMFAEDEQTLTVAAQEGLSKEHVEALRFRKEDGIPRCIAVDGAHRLTADLAEDSRYPSVAREEGLHSMLSVPMLDGTQYAGALNVYSRPLRHFRVEEAQKLDLLASFAMSALRQARQFEREQRIAQAFQRDLLPEPRPGIAGLEVARKSIAALPLQADVGGDFYDVHVISETQLGVVIGDVAGKGLAAAPRTAMVKCVLRAFAFESPSPGQVLERLNRLLHRTMEGEQFVTLFYGLLDVEKGELTYANAGHELPLMLRRGSGDPELLETTGPLLGLDSASSYHEVRTRIGEGDTLVLYTDGFTEARRGDEFLEVKGLASILDTYREATAHAMVESVSQSVHKKYGSLRDDATILVVKREGS